MTGPLLAIVDQNNNFERRLEYLDSLIKNTESNPRVPLDGVKDIIREIHLVAVILALNRMCEIG